MIGGILAIGTGASPYSGTAGGMRSQAKVEGKDATWLSIDNRYAQAGTARAPTGAVVDEGLRAYMLRVYNYMAAGIVLTGIVAYLVFSQAVRSTRPCGQVGRRRAIA